MDVNYLNEAALPGQLGHLLAIIGFIAALFASICYAISTNTKSESQSKSWLNLGRVGFGFNVLSILGIFIILFLLILNHKFEYHYVWQHSSLTLPIRYMISCFWEGQEGSFLLWAFWHAVLGIVIIFTAKKYEAPVMAVLCITQFYLASMLLGIYFFDYKIGSTPFILLRDFMQNAPIFERADYLSFIEDGNGLNPLLQNYWMTIHPPTLFLGFASTLIPFAYVVAGLWKMDFSKRWALHTLNWSLFSGGILGLGVLMGAAWAYESLTFGGFWAWDPVENASLVPWLTLVAGIHTLAIYRHTGYSLKASLIIFIITFLLILYSTFLTRSGILGDTSVHAFTDLGMSGQLVIYILMFAIPSIILFLVRYKDIPGKVKEENIYSREFWMFVGSLLLIAIAFFITLDTSWPVINKLFGTNVTITDPINHYNRYALWFAVLIMLGSGMVQYLRYKKDNLAAWMKRLITAVAITVVLTVALSFISGIYTPVYVILMLAGVFGIAANFTYVTNVIKGKIKVAGPAVAHMGFALIMIGILLSAGDKEVISINKMNVDYGEAFDETNRRQNILLQKDMPLKMAEYNITYKGDSVSGPNIYYKVNYQKMKDDKVVDEFNLYPNAQIDEKMGLVASPDTRHYLWKDLYTHVSQVPQRNIDPSELKTELHEFQLGVNDSTTATNFAIKLGSFNPKPTNLNYIPKEGDIAISGVLAINNGLGQYIAEPIYYIRDSRVFSIPATVPEVGLTINFTNVDPQTGKGTFEIVEQEKLPEYIIMKAIVFPFINVLWLGCIMMVVGFWMSVWRRFSELKRLKE